MEPVPINRFESGTGLINRFQKKIGLPALIYIVLESLFNSLKRIERYQFYNLYKMFFYTFFVEKSSKNYF
jgi:hypothetical protein